MLVVGIVIVIAVLVAVVLESAVDGITAQILWIIIYKRGCWMVVSG
jgi:hypothetical protein